MCKLVLLVEDNPADEELTVRALKKSGIPVQIAVACDGEQAAALLAPDKALPDLILLDLKLSKMSGLDLLARLRADPRTGNLPIVMLSSSTKPEDVGSAYDLGCNGYLSKGVDYRQFVESAKVVVEYWLVHNIPPAQASTPHH